MQKADDFHCLLSAPRQVKSGAPLALHFKLVNTSKQQRSVLIWHTPLEGWWSRFLRVTREGEEIRYRGPMAKRVDPQRAEYRRLAPGKSAAATLDLTAVYDLRQPGIYQVQYIGGLFDAAPSGVKIPRPLSQHKPTKLLCPDLEIEVTP